jgi:hypothetical protein
MANLTTTAFYTRKGVKYGLIGLVVFLILRFLFLTAVDYWQKLHPPPPPPPTVAFGKLPQIEFPEPANLPAEISYKLETAEGIIPQTEDIGKVYTITKVNPSLLGLDRAKELARKMGFAAEPVQITPRLYRFLSQATPVTTLEIDTVTGYFTLKYDYRNDQSILAEKKLPSDEQAVKEAKNFLSTLGLLEKDLNEGEGKVTYYRFSPEELLPAISLSEADFVRVDLFRQLLDEKKVIADKPNQSLIYFTLSGSRERQKRMIEVKYVYSPLERENFATYPLKSASEAWSELNSGAGYIAELGDNQNGQITIRRIFLAYYESEKPQNYLQPIFVFEGDNNFSAFVPAVDPDWVD